MMINRWWIERDLDVLLAQSRRYPAFFRKRKTIKPCQHRRCPRLEHSTSIIQGSKSTATCPARPWRHISDCSIRRGKLLFDSAARRWPLIQDVSFIATPSTAGLSNRKPAPAGTSWYNGSAQYSDKRCGLYLFTPFLHTNNSFMGERESKMFHTYVWYSLVSMKTFTYESMTNISTLRAKQTQISSKWRQGECVKKATSTLSSNS